MLSQEAINEFKEIFKKVFNIELSQQEAYAHLSPVHKRESMEMFCSAMDTIWTPSAKSGNLQESANMLFIDEKTSKWRRGRVVDGGGLENR